MNRKMNVFDVSMSLHKIKDMIQLMFADQQADFITNNLEALIENTYRIAPVRKADKEYPLFRPDNRTLTPSSNFLEKHWEEAIFRKWETVEDGLDPLIPFRKIVSYQVMLRNTNKDEGWGELDLLGASADNIPVAIELKTNPQESLLRAIVEVLANGVALRKAWGGVDGCTLCSQWRNTVGKIDRIVDMPLVVMAPASYWEVILSNSTKRIKNQTQEPVRQSINKLIETMYCKNYPLTLVQVNSEQQLSESELPVIINAVRVDM